jgi:hypothetical protein
MVTHCPFFLLLTRPLLPSHSSTTLRLLLLLLLLLLLGTGKPSSRCLILARLAATLLCAEPFSCFALLPPCHLCYCPFNGLLALQPHVAQVSGGCQHVAGVEVLPVRQPQGVLQDWQE